MNDLNDMLGCIGEDNISHYQGLIIGLTSYTYGCNRYHLQGISPQKNGTMGPIVTLDVQRVKFVKEGGISISVVESKIELGSIVRDTLGGAEGVVTGVTIYAFGEFPYYTIEPQSCKDGAPAESFFFHEPRLEIVKKDKPKVERGAKLPGGPRDQGMPHHK